MTIAASVSGNEEQLEDALQESGIDEAYDFWKNSVKELNFLLYSYIMLSFIAIGVFWLSLTKLLGIVKGDFSLKSTREAVLSFNILIAYFFFFFVTVTAGLNWFRVLSEGSIVVYAIMVTFILLGVLNLAMLIWWRMPFAKLYSYQTKNSQDK